MKYLQLIFSTLTLNFDIIKWIYVSMTHHTKGVMGDRKDGKVNTPVVDVELWKVKFSLHLSNTKMGKYCHCTEI